MHHYAQAFLVLLGAVQPLTAQLKSVPVYPIVAARPGLAAALDYGSGLSDASGRGRLWGGRVGVGTGRVQLTASGGAWDAGALASAQFGGTGVVRVLGSGSGGLAWHTLAGLGYTRSGAADSTATYLTVPLGLAVVHTGLRTARGAVTPWLASVAELDRVSFGAIRATQAGVGLSGGLSAMLYRRLGAHVALEGVKMFRRRGGGVTLREGTRITMGAGVHVLLSGTP